MQDWTLFLSLSNATYLLIDLARVYVLCGVRVQIVLNKQTGGERNCKHPSLQFREKSLLDGYEQPFYHVRDVETTIKFRTHSDVFNRAR